MLYLILLCASSGSLRAEESAIEKPTFCQLPFFERRQAAGIDKDLYSYWETVTYANVYGILDVPRIGTEKDENGKPFKHNAASRGYRHGDSGTELAFKLVGFLGDDERLPTDPYVWIPVDRRTVFWHEGLYLVPLLKIVEKVSLEGGAVRFKRVRYELLPGKFPLPRIRLADKPSLRKALKEWKELSELPDGEGTCARRISLFKNTLEDSCFDSMHASSLLELQQLGIFKEPLTEEDARFWCERMLSPHVYRQARQDIADVLADDLRNVSTNLARFVIHQAAIYSNPASARDKLDRLDSLPAVEEASLLRKKLSILVPAFILALKDPDIQRQAADVLAEVNRSELRDKLLAWIEIPETRMIAIKLGYVLGADLEFARRATQYFAECEALKAANDVQGIGQCKDDKRWIEMRDVMDYLLVPSNKGGQQIVMNQLEATPPATSKIRALIGRLIHTRDDRFIDSVHAFAENVFQSKGGDRTGELYAALAYLAMWNHPDADELAKRCLKENKPSAYQIRMCKQYLSRVTTQLGKYRTFNSSQECLEWIAACGGRN